MEIPCAATPSRTRRTHQTGNVYGLQAYCQFPWRSRRRLDLHLTLPSSRRLTSTPPHPPPGHAQITSPPATAAAADPPVSPQRTVQATLPGPAPRSISTRTPPTPRPRPRRHVTVSSWNSTWSYPPRFSFVAESSPGRCWSVTLR